MSSKEEKNNMDLESSAAKSLFLGTIIEQNLFPFPKFSAEEKETLELVVESIDKFLAGKDEEFRKYDTQGAQPDEYVDALKELGLFGLIIPEEYGGIGLSNSGYSRVLQQTSKYDASTSLTVGAHSSIGMKGLLLFGTDEQKKKYLPKLASGEYLGCFGLTEPDFGSNPGGMLSKFEDKGD
ncbi:MAG: acyl-CoA dehydrogenase family protein, partial [Bdellovibrionales bacterium]|nr:acyl-CoA dehydrogenase family protein [Bdellovibrionales bacterium]